MNAVYDEALKSWNSFNETGVVADYTHAVAALTEYEQAEKPKGYKTKESFTQVDQCCSYTDYDGDGIDDGHETSSNPDPDGIGGIP